MKKPDLERLSDRISKYPVIVAYLFGSESKGESGTLSDIDIAVFIDKGIDTSREILRILKRIASAFPVACYRVSS